VPGDRRPPAAGPRERAQHVDRRRLAGAVGPEEAEGLPGLDLEVDVADRLDLAEALGERLDRDRRHASTVEAAPGASARREAPRAGAARGASETGDPVD